MLMGQLRSSVHLVRVFAVSSLLLTVACAKDAADSGDSESAVPTGQQTSMKY